MDDQTRKLLLSADNEGWEVPNNDWTAFPYDELVAQVVAIQRRLNADLNLTLERDGCVQDASFLDQLHIRSLETDERGYYIMPLVIRFSNFGKLFTVSSSLQQLPDSDTLDNVVRIVKGYGWQYVPSDVLGAPYDGQHQDFRDAEMSWWHRFFEYT